jgi:hypothetical protein
MQEERNEGEGKGEAENGRELGQPERGQVAAPIDGLRERQDRGGSVGGQAGGLIPVAPLDSCSVKSVGSRHVRRVPGRHRLGRSEAPPKGS